MTLLVDVNHPGFQEDFVTNWEPAHSLVEDAISGAEIAPCFLTLAIACLPLCLWWQEGPVRSWLALLWFCSLLYSVSRPGCASELFTRKFSLSLSLSFFFSLASPQFGLLSHVSYLRLSSGHSGHPKHAAHASLFSPRCWRRHASRLPLCWESRLGT